MKNREIKSAVLGVALVASSAFCLAEGMEYKIGNKVYSIPESQRANIDEVIEYIELGYDVSHYGVTDYTVESALSMEKSSLSQTAAMTAAASNSLVLYSTWESGELNGFDQQVFATCPKNMFIRTISSYHKNSTEDRIFSMTCGKYLTGDKSKIYRQEVTWDSNWANDWDRPLNYTCADGSFMVGMNSVHDNKKEDRRFRFACAHMSASTTGQAFSTGSCKSTATSQYDKPWTLGGGAVIGMNSTHSNGAEDRITSLQYCTSIEESGW